MEDEDSFVVTPSPVDTDDTTLTAEIENGRIVDAHRRQSISVKMEQRDRTPDMAVQDFNGNFQSVYGGSVKTRTCTREVFNFAVSAVIILSALLTCLILLGVYGFEAPGAEWLKTIAAFCLGVFLPNPQVKPPKVK